jgi:hypothetical protein
MCRTGSRFYCEVANVVSTQTRPGSSDLPASPRLLLVEHDRRRRRRRRALRGNRPRLAPDAARGVVGGVEHERRGGAGGVRGRGAGGERGVVRTREQASYHGACASRSSNPIGAGAVNRGPRTIAEKAYVPGPSDKCDPKHRPTISGKNEPELKGQPAKEGTKERCSSCVPIMQRRMCNDRAS